MPNSFKVKHIKTALINFLTRLELEPLPTAKRKEVGEIVAHLSAKNVFIPASHASEKQVHRFVELFFSAYPALMTFENKIIVEQFLSNKNLDALTRANKQKK